VRESNTFEGGVGIDPAGLGEGAFGLFLSVPLGLAFTFFRCPAGGVGPLQGAAFVPTHIGMPIVHRDGKLDFLTKQVRASRNVAGGWWVTTLMGGLNYQIEHLFSSMPRCHG